MMAIGFLGYVLPMGQMSLWGNPEVASYANLLLNIIITLLDCLAKIFQVNFAFISDIFLEGTNLSYLNSVLLTDPTVLSRLGWQSVSYAEKDLNKISSAVQGLTKSTRLRADKRIGPHNHVVLSILFGSLLGDGHGERRKQGNGTRFTFYQEGFHVSYLLWLHNLLLNLGYCSPNIPNIQTRLGEKGTVRKIIRFRTWTFTSFNWIHELWYIKGVKVVPLNIGDFLTPLALAIWIMDDGGKVNQALKLSTNSFSYSDCLLLVKVLHNNFKLKASVQSAGVPNQYQIYIWKESMPLLREIVLPYVHSSMSYKLGY